MANELHDWTAESMEIIHGAGKILSFENQATDITYPKAWNQKSMKQAIPDNWGCHHLFGQVQMRHVSKMLLRLRG